MIRDCVINFIDRLSILYPSSIIKIIAMESNRRQSEDRDSRQGRDWDSRYREENHRVGQALYQRDQQNQARHPQDRYRDGLNYHNRNEGYSNEQTHYGSRPDSAYRNPDINFGDNPYRQDNDHRYDRPAYRQNEGTSSRSPYPDYTRPEQHHDGFWNERDRYKDDDYRYRSGNRPTNRSSWHRADDLDYDEDDRARQRGDYRGRDEGFFDRIGNSISNTWRNMTHDDEGDRSGNTSYRNRDFNRGYESGPRWADENNNDRNRQGRSYRDGSDWY